MMPAEMLVSHRERHYPVLPPKDYHARNRDIVNASTSGDARRTRTPPQRYVVHNPIRGITEEFSCTSFTRNGSIKTPDEPKYLWRTSDELKPLLKMVGLTGGRSNKLILVPTTFAIMTGGWQMMGAPMLKQYQRTGSVTVPVVNMTVRLPDIPGSWGRVESEEYSTGFPVSEQEGPAVEASRSADRRRYPTQVSPRLKGVLRRRGIPVTSSGRRGTRDKAKNVAMAGNGCDTRNDILKRDLMNVTLDRNKCTVLSGTLKDPYTGKTINFQRGPESAKVQIDHIIALECVGDPGQQSSKDQRTSLANDPLNLVAVDGPANGQKSDGDACHWLPPNKGARCSYAVAQVNVKKK